jgi:hypothetical protein
MAIKQQLTKRRWLTIAAAAAIYAGLWWFTETVGVPEVRRVTVNSIEQPILPINPSEPTEPAAVPVYWCFAAAYGPLVVRAKYQWQNGAAEGAGHSYYLWLFGPAIRIHHVPHGTSSAAAG